MPDSRGSSHPDTAAHRDTVAREVASVMKALVATGFTVEQSEAYIALGRLGAWAEVGLNRSLPIVETDTKVMTGGRRG